MTEFRGAVSSDIDTLASIYQGRGCTRPDGYTYAELHIGMENFCKFLEKYDVPATMFVVGDDYLHTQNHKVLKAAFEAGHEIANHTQSHAQGFRFLSLEEKEAEIRGVEEICEEVIGKKPVGFRSPGWNVSDDALPILKSRGYLYDSSVFPTYLMPFLKLYNWLSSRSRPGPERTTLGHMRYMLAPLTPYTTRESHLGRQGKADFFEFPITVSPNIRFPFTATFLFMFGLDTFKYLYKHIRRNNQFLQFQFHLSDFVDYNHPHLADQVPKPNQGVYIPKALFLPLEEKLTLFSHIMDMITEDYTFRTLESWSVKFRND